MYRDVRLIEFYRFGRIHLQIWQYGETVDLFESYFVADSANKVKGRTQKMIEGLIQFLSRMCNKQLTQ